MGCEPHRLSSLEPRRGATSRARAGCKFISSRLLATIALFIASLVSTHAQTDWTGRFSSDWFLSGNWDAGFPRQTTDGNINTVTPNSTVVASPGALARNLSVGANGTGMLTIQAGGTLADSFGTVGNLPRGLGTVTVTGAGSNWSNAGSVVVGGQGTGTLTIQDGGTVNSGGGSVGLSVGSNGMVTVTGPGSSWINGPSGGLNIGSFGTGTLTIANGGKVINITNFTANIGNGTGSQGMVTVTGAGSAWSNSSGVNIGNLGTGTLTIADSGIVIGPVVIARNTGAIGTLNIGAGAGNPAAAPGTLNTANVAFGSGIGTLNFNHTSANYVFAPAISGNGTVNVLAGATTLTGANSYSGATNVDAGTLRAGALNTFSPNSAATVAGGGTLDLNGFNQTVPGVTNAALVNMGTGTAPRTILTTTSYIGTGGTVAMNTFLGGDGSPSDRLVINGGSATGNSLLRITNAGGPGAETVANGIAVVQAINGGTTAPGAFALSAGELRAGAFDYDLFRGSVDASAPNDWFLRSDFIVPPIPPTQPMPPIAPLPPATSLPPTPPPEPLPPGVYPIIGPEIATYGVVQPLARQLGLASLGTLNDRVGRYLRGRKRPMRDGKRSGAAQGARAGTCRIHGRLRAHRLAVLGLGPLLRPVDRQPLSRLRGSTRRRPSGGLPGGHRSVARIVHRRPRGARGPLCRLWQYRCRREGPRHQSGGDGLHPQPHRDARPRRLVGWSLLDPCGAGRLVSRHGAAGDPLWRLGHAPTSPSSTPPAPASSRRSRADIHSRCRNSARAS